MNYLNKCSLCDAVLKGVYALDDTYEICIDCAEDDGILNRQVRMSPRVQLIRQHLEAEKNDHSTHDLYLTRIAQRLVPDGERLDIRLIEGLKDYYALVSFFQEVEVGKCKSKPTVNILTPEYAANEVLQKALREVFQDCMTDEEFETWLIESEKTGKSTQDLYLTGSAQTLVPDGDWLDIRLSKGLKDYYDVLSFFQNEEIRKCKSKYTMGFPTSEYAINQKLQKALRVVTQDFPSRRREIFLFGFSLRIL